MNRLFFFLLLLTPVLMIALVKGLDNTTEQDLLIIKMTTRNEQLMAPSKLQQDSIMNQMNIVLNYCIHGCPKWTAGAI